MPRFFNSTCTAALVVLLAAAPAAVMAQATTGTDGTATTATPAPNTDAASSPGLAPAAPEGEAPVQPVEGQIVMQSEDTILADNLMGSTVYTTAGDEKVGDISNLIISLDGQVEGVVIGVGGFLGLGKKMVAVEMNSLQVMQDENGNPRLVTAATKADLEAAEAFVTAKEQADAAAAAQAQSDAAPVGGTIGGEPAPAAQ